jgi:D-threo-aldose 1-dehydrogenase
MPDVSQLGFGTAGIGNHRRKYTDAESSAVLEAAWDVGIRHFDTAPHYGLGLAERRLGDFLTRKARHEYVVSTKVGRRLESVEPPHDVDDEGFEVAATSRRRWDFSGDGVRDTLHDSLARLRLDHVDIAYLHDPERWDLSAALAAGVPALRHQETAGLIGSAGVASMDSTALCAAAMTDGVSVLMAAGRRTLATPDLGTELLDSWMARGQSVVAAAILNGGLLSGPVNESSTFDYVPAPANIRIRVQRISDICADHRTSLRTAALQYPLRHDAVRVVVVGGETPEQVRQNAQALTAKVPDGLWSDLASEGLVPG